MKPVAAGTAEQQKALNRCRSRLLEWERVGYVRSYAETMDWLISHGLTPVQAGRLLQELGYVR